MIEVNIQVRSMGPISGKGSVYFPKTVSFSSVVKLQKALKRVPKMGLTSTLDLKLELRR